MPFGFRKKGEEKQQIITNITDKEDLDEIKKIAGMLNPNEEVFVVARQSRLKPGGSHFTPNIVFATDRRIIKDPSMLGLHEEVVDIPYDMITSVRLDKGVFSSNVIFRAPGLRSTGSLGMIEKLTGSEYDSVNSGTGEDTVITAIPKDKAQELVEVIRNGVDRQREVYQQPQPQQQFQPQTTPTPQHAHIDTTSNNNNPTISIADELAKLANLKKQGVITESEFLQMKQDLIRRK
jgi:Bacterial PH domain/Short C-terminal domain